MFKPVASKVSFPDLEKAILQFWKERRIFERSVEERPSTGSGQRPQDKLFVLYEGPPTANGSPGIHHVLARVFKDVIPRYKTMKGYRAPRKGGWDTHGLPVELEVERELGISTKKDIEAYGIERFNAKCKESVFRYVKEWEAMTDRIGFWVDMADAYVTYDNSYIESGWWILKRFWDEGLIYQDFKVTPHCPRCGTSLSSHEVALGYRDDVPDPSVYVKFRLDPASTNRGRTLPQAFKSPAPTFFLVWTTTPWTLPANTALAVAPEAHYALAEVEGGERLILAQALLGQAVKEPYKVIATFLGEELEGLRYEPLFPTSSKEDGAYRIVSGDFVSLEDGTGIVHMAPAYGEIDLEVGRAEGLPLVHTVDLQGLVAPGIPGEGLFVKQADPLISEDLKARGLLYRAETITHTYPFCWRCDSPLLYYAKTSWYIRTTAKKERLISANQEINWYPEHIKEGRFGEWLRGNVDWAISRERYWGTPLPIWRCESCGEQDCMGGSADGTVSPRAELQGKPGYAGPQGEFDLHRPLIDQATFTCPQCGSVMRRVPEVIDCWFDSGAMPYAQWHYPFENEATFQRQFPADYICEAVDQTRGWFYSLHALSTLLFDGPSYRNVICLGHILDAKGEKMSKSRGNVVNPWSVLDVHGADATRWYLFTATAPGNPRRFSSDLVAEVVRRFLLTLWNTYSFFVLYANIDGFDPRQTPDKLELSDLDRWVLSELNGLIGAVDGALEGYDPTGAGRRIQDFVDLLSNWYVRRSRRRFWKSESDTDKAAAYTTLYTCLVTLAKLLAPFTPFVAEELYQNLVRSVPFDRLRTADEAAPESVHLAEFPVADLSLVDAELDAATRLSMRVVSLGRAARSVAGVAGRHIIPADQTVRLGIRVRQPLAKVLVKVVRPTERGGLASQVSQVLDELNVKEMAFIDDVQPYLEQMLAKKPDLGVGEDFVFGLEDFAVAKGGDLWVVLDTRLTPELRAEGLARELVHRLQTMRRSAGFEVADRIITYYQAPADLAQVVGDYADYIRQETLSLELVAGAPPQGSHVEKQRLEGQEIVLGVKRAG